MVQDKEKKKEGQTGPLFRGGGEERHGVSNFDPHLKDSEGGKKKDATGGLNWVGGEKLRSAKKTRHSVTRGREKRGFPV